MLYLDANVFLYPALYTGPKAERATKILQSVFRGDESAVTAALTVDEVVWVFQEELERRAAIRQGRRLLEWPNLRILDVRALDVHSALSFMERYDRLRPRDAIHAAVATNAGVFTIVSDDADFDHVKELNRTSLGSA